MTLLWAVMKNFRTWQLAGNAVWTHTYVQPSHLRMPEWVQALVVLGVWAVPVLVLAILLLGSLNPVSKSQQCPECWWEVQETL